MALYSDLRRPDGSVNIYITTEIASSLLAQVVLSRLLQAVTATLCTMSLTFSGVKQYHIYQTDTDNKI